MYQSYLVLGGAGLVGLQVCRRIARTLAPKRIAVASLLEREAAAAVESLREEFGDQVEFTPVWGNLFVPAALADLDRRDVMADPALRRALLAWLYGDFDAAYGENHLVQLIGAHRPDVIVDCVNTATGLSYQNVFDGAKKVMDWLGDGTFAQEGISDLESFLLSQSVPQIVRHVRFVHRATRDYGTRFYLKVGTTGTGGMGLNIPYTHSEDKPSQVLLAKTEAAFGHTGLLFLLARTPDGPIVKEIKPAAMIGYKAVRTVVTRDKHGNDQLFEPVRAEIRGSLALRAPEAPYAPAGRLEVTIVDTGENGVFTRGEFAAITALGQMEYVTPEEIAQAVVLEIRGANTGMDVIGALDSSVMNPSYKAGLMRSVALSDLKHAEQTSEFPSVALGKLGPPELSKLLFEAQLLKEVYGTLAQALECEGRRRSPEEVSAAVEAQLLQSKVRVLASSIGIPILASTGDSFLRGPRINVPEVVGHQTVVSLDDPAQTERWIQKGWIDLRPSNMERWLTRLGRMVHARMALRDSGSAAASIGSYLPTEFEIGEVVAWIFNNEMEGYRIK